MKSRNQLHRGSRGGTYYITSNGNKIYCPKYKLSKSKRKSKSKSKRKFKRSVNKKKSQRKFNLEELKQIQQLREQRQLVEKYRRMSNPEPQKPWHEKMLELGRYIRPYEEKLDKVYMFRVQVPEIKENRPIEAYEDDLMQFMESYNGKYIISSVEVENDNKTINGFAHKGKDNIPISEQDIRDAFLHFEPNTIILHLDVIPFFPS
jgi:hypothetical protein